MSLVKEDETDLLERERSYNYKDKHISSQKYHGEDLTNKIYQVKPKTESNNNKDKNRPQNMNKVAYYVRLIIILGGGIIIGMNSITNMLVTDEESEGLRDKVIGLLTFYTNFLENKNFYSKLVSMMIACFYDLFVLFGIYIWIFKSKTNNALYSSIFFFCLMMILQYSFHIEMPLVKTRRVYVEEIATPSIFLNYPVNKFSYYNGPVGFLLIIILECYQNNYIKTFIFGLLYLANLIAYLMALHNTNTLCVMSSIFAAIYFDKISSIFMRNNFDLINVYTNTLFKSNIKLYQKSNYQVQISYNNNLIESNAKINNFKNTNCRGEIEYMQKSGLEDEKDEIHDELVSSSVSYPAERNSSLNGFKSIRKRSYESINNLVETSFKNKKIEKNNTGKSICSENIIDKLEEDHHKYSIEQENHIYNFIGTNNQITPKERYSKTKANNSELDRQ